MVRTHRVVHPKLASDLVSDCLAGSGSDCASAVALHVLGSLQVGLGLLHSGVGVVARLGRSRLPVCYWATREVASVGRRALRRSVARWRTRGGAVGSASGGGLIR